MALGDVLKQIGSDVGAGMTFTLGDLALLTELVGKLERNRHFIGNAVDVGCACMNFRMALERHGGEIQKAMQPVRRPDPCTEQTPCCDRRNEYNGFNSGPHIFECPKGCACHD